MPFDRQPEERGYHEGKAVVGIRRVTARDELVYPYTVSKMRGLDKVDAARVFSSVSMPTKGSPWNDGMTIRTCSLSQVEVTIRKVEKG